MCILALYLKHNTMEKYSNTVVILKKDGTRTTHALIATSNGNWYVQTSDGIVVYNSEEMSEIFNFTPTELDNLKIVMEANKYNFFKINVYKGWKIEKGDYNFLVATNMNDCDANIITAKTIQEIITEINEHLT